MEKLNFFVLHQGMLHLDVPIEGVLGTVASVAVIVGTEQALYDIFVAPPLGLFSTFGLASLYCTHLLEQLQHHLVLLLGLLNLFF